MLLPRATTIRNPWTHNGLHSSLVSNYRHNQALTDRTPIASAPTSVKNKKNQALGGFTLVELLVVIVIIATLVSLSITAVMRFRKSADKTIALGNMRQIQTANISYASDHQGRFIPPVGQVTVAMGGATHTGTYDWFENPELLSELKGDQSTFGSGLTPDTSLPIALMDPSVVREKPANYQNLSGSYAYTRLSTENAVRNSQLVDGTRSAAFITADGDGFINFDQTTSNIAYRHGDKAIVVYYGGQAAALRQSEIPTDSADIFWVPAP